MDTRMEVINEAAAYLSQRLQGKIPYSGIVLGSGLGKLADKIENSIVIKYSDIPGFVRSTATGHKGNFIAGYLGGKFVLAMQGRFHFYEGYPMEKVVLPIRVMVKLGIKVLFVSNAAGGVNFDFKVGDLMIIRDHINLLPNPLIGPNLDEFGPRFPDMTRPYDPGLIKKAKEIAASLDLELKEGVYLASTGPTYETPAEYKFYRMAGGDLVGMSTIPEVIVARHCSMRVFGMSVVTNEAAGDFAEDYQNDAMDVVNAADAAARKMTTVFTELITSL